MARVTVTRQAVELRLTPMEKALCLRGTLRIPLRHVAGASAEPVPHATQEGIRLGIGVPGTSHGTVATPDGLAFCAYRNPHRCLTLRLSGERYVRVVVEVDPPQAPAAVRAEIEAAVGAPRSPTGGTTA